MDAPVWIHDTLDNGAAPPPGREAAEQMESYREVSSLLEASRQPAPPDFSVRVMARLPEALPRARQSPWWRLPCFAPARWLAPALGGAAVALLVVWLGLGFEPGRQPQGVAVTFELHAPGARQVELVGSFNNWKPGDIALIGPDATGHWTATVEVPAGRHEYLFLVDGREWRTDPSAPSHRPDGFGRENALLEL